MHVCIVYYFCHCPPLCACAACSGHVGVQDLCMGAWVHVYGLEAMKGRNPELPLGRRHLGQGAKEAKETCVGTHTHTHPLTMSSDLEGHLLQSGSLAASAQSGSKISPRQLHRIIPFHLIPSTNCVQCDWSVFPGALRRRLKRCLLTLCVSYDSECVGGEQVAH